MAVGMSVGRRGIRTPFTMLEGRIGFGQRWLRWAAGAVLVTSVLIVVGGGVVRVTGSGLGCPDWPTCEAGSLAPTPELGVHGVIEFTNRMLTDVLCVVVGALIIVARLQRVPRPRITRWAWAQFWVVVLNAVVGGLTVLARLSPYVVAAHFLAAMLLLTAATVAWDLVSRLDGTAPEPAMGRISFSGRVLLAGSAVLLIVGTAVTGTGPHAGDSSGVRRMPFDWLAVTWVHSLVAVAVVGVTAMLWRSARPGGGLRTRSAWLLVALAAQGVIGIVQAVIGLPAAVVVAHMCGAALVWIGAVRVALETGRAAAVSAG
ncbi:COX15/CtaA family protein [Nocardia terpenica]|uniref:COX15/CtaA family protein n=1 Tax=Nocardia terpenica TaxID=455432 RepID=UPI0018D572FC|nr:COX15/CtaA family protein [Nocardia terpenica]